MGAAACTTEFPERGERPSCVSDLDCQGTERCAELTPGDLNCWPEEIACAAMPCPDPTGGPSIIPIGDPGDAAAGGAVPSGPAPVGGDGSAPPAPATEPPAESACPQAERITECPVDNEGFCVYEPSDRLLTIPCSTLCEHAGLDCEGTSEDYGEVCTIDSYFPDCDSVGIGLACVCVR